MCACAAYTIVFEIGILFAQSFRLCDYYLRRWCLTKLRKPEEANFHMHLHSKLQLCGATRYFYVEKGVNTVEHIKQISQS